MTREMYTIFDSEAQMYQVPFYDTNDGTAIRRLQEFATKNPDDVMVRFSDQFSLFNCGVFDESTGTLHPIEPTLINTMKKIIIKKE